MTAHFTADDVIMSVTRLTHAQLGRYVETDLVRPQNAGNGLIYRAVDIARLELLCDLAEDLDLDEHAVGVVIALVDQLHGARQELMTLATVIEALPADLRSRIAVEMRQV